MQKIKTFYRSFLFRIGSIIFFLLGGTLTAYSILIHFKSIDVARQNIHLIINAHAQEISEAAARYGSSYAADLVDAISDENTDTRLYLLFNNAQLKTGSLAKWPALIKRKDGFYEALILSEKKHLPVHLLIQKIVYPDQSTLLVGYDTERIDLLKNRFMPVLLENLVLALIIALCASFLIIWVLARHLRGFNLACDQVRSGMLDYRIASNHTNDEFDRLGVNINRMLDWNKALILTIKESINAIAHDMRTPLSHLRLELRALSERHALTEDARLAVLSHVERVDELINMFDNLLNIAKAESRASTELFEPFDMSQLVRDIVDFYQPIIDEKKISCVMNLPKTTAIIKGDKQLLGQAIMNLLDNACKYTPTQGLIQVTLSQSDGLTTFTMTDNGQGIPEHLLERAKERFFRADCSRNSSGHGLGLSLVNAVAHLHQGFLELSNHQPGLMVRLVMQSDHIKKL